MSIVLGRRGAEPSRCLPRRRRQRPRPWLWFAPVVVLLLTVTLYPTALVVWISVQKTRYYAIEGFVGLANYAAVLSSAEFLQLSRNSLIYVLSTLAVVLPVGLVSALLLQSLGRLGIALRVALLVPWTLSMAVVGVFWLWILNPSYGLIRFGLESIGVEPGLMLGDPGLALWLMVLVTAWWSFSYAMVMMSAAVQSVPRELQEAVSIDGGGRFASFVHVTWPHIAPTLGSTALALSIVYLTLITLIIVLTGGGPIGATSTWSFAVFRGTVQSVNIAPAAVLSVVVLIVNLALGYGYIRWTGRVYA
jgi:multiple sugar transport system permease protein